jgi:hypothetical protein
MAHFAQLDENNVVIDIITVSNEVITDENGNESEELGVEFCKSICGPDTRWIQTSYNANFRKNYASVGGTYDPVQDAFIPKKILSTGVFDQDSCNWIYPPPDGQTYEWDTEASNFKLVTP